MLVVSKGNYEFNRPFMVTCCGCLASLLMIGASATEFANHVGGKTLNKNWANRYLGLFLDLSPNRFKQGPEKRKNLSTRFRHFESLVEVLCLAGFSGHF